MSHDPEPWQEGIGLEVISADGIPILTVHARPPIERPKASLRRLVACVNALRDVPTEFLEKLEPGYLAEMIEHLLAIGKVVNGPEGGLGR